MAKKKPKKLVKRKSSKPARKTKKPVKKIKKATKVAKPRRVITFGKKESKAAKPVKKIKPDAPIPVATPVAPTPEQDRKRNKKATESNYKVGMIVDHPNRPQWGPGKIIAVTEDRIHVIFRDQLERTAKTIITSVMPLGIATTQSDAVLDLLPTATEVDGSWKLPKNYAGLNVTGGSVAEIKPKHK